MIDGGIAGAAPYIVAYDERMFFAVLVLGVIGLAFYLTRDRGDD